MIKQINNEEFKEQVLNEDGKVKIVDFFATWCNPCRMLAPVLEELDKKYDELEIYKIDVDENSALADELDISSVPTLLIYRDGKIVKQVMGFQPIASLESIVKSL